MTRKKPFLLIAAVAVAALCAGLYAGLDTAQAGEPPAATRQAPATVASGVQPVGDTTTGSVDPAKDQAVTCSCASAGSGCSGACPNAPGPQRHCKNAAPAGKPKVCACL